MQVCSTWIPSVHKQLKDKTLSKAGGSTANKSFLENRVDMASFCSDYNISDIFSPERSEITSSKDESKLRKSAVKEPEEKYAFDW